MHTTHINEAQPMLDTWATVGDFNEVISTEFFLFFEAEKAMIDRNDLQMILHETLPEFFLMPLFAQRWSEDVLGAFEAGGVHVFQR